MRVWIWVTYRLGEEWMGLEWMYEWDQPDTLAVTIRMAFGAYTFVSKKPLQKYSFDLFWLTSFPCVEIPLNIGTYWKSIEKPIRSKRFWLFSFSRRYLGVSTFGSDHENRQENDKNWNFILASSKHNIDEQLPSSAHLLGPSLGQNYRRPLKFGSVFLFHVWKVLL